MKFLKRKKNIEIEEIDITSLLDILVILLVFLLQNMTNAELTPETVANLTLPYSKSTGLARQGVIAQVNNKKQVFIDNQQIGRNLDDPSMNKILIERLKQLKADPHNIKYGNVDYLNILVDRNLEYDYVQKLMGSAVEAGFSKFKLVVQGLE